MIDSHATAARWGVHQTVLIAGLAAALVEMAVVLPVQYTLGVPPPLLFQSIASGWQGEAAYSGGVGSALFGAALHLVISIVAAGIFVYASRIWPVLVHRYVFAGLVYGALVYAVMTYLVVPMSAATVKPATDTPLIATSFAVHLLFFGLPISLMNRHGGVRMRFS
jgi:uncharacterized membrane protein YagU involved in acid resistance